MLKSIKLSLIYILINCNLVLASENIKLISIEDVNIIFSTDIKSWNQNLIFLDKKLNMQKLQIENNDCYSLKTFFNNGYVIITPYFKSDAVEYLNLNYTIDKIDTNTLDFISTHFYSFGTYYCNSIKINKNNIIINIKNC